ncbi:MAG: outer membrane beta-barrel protein, partial [Burkholderiaceae bacterium]|nr:outer membrane beta-barrel protein [Burkholderiaceae bacterium]
MRLSVAAACAICLFSGWGMAASAQQQTAVNQGAMGAAYLSEGSMQDDFLRQETVMTRQHPETDPLGVHAGSFLIYPSVGTEEKYNDNIYATNSGTITDYITTVSPAVTVRSNWNNGLVVLNATNSNTFYAQHTTENTNDYAFNGNGRLDITRSEYISVKGGYSHLHEDRTS